MTEKAARERVLHGGGRGQKGEPINRKSKKIDGRNCKRQGRYSLLARAGLKLCDYGFVKGSDGRFYYSGSN